ncbi:hypothetical protein PV327_010034 [Microctonus hyperodae]|uniref:Neurogenic protein big brain n=1 Tax=Microctonus hyperodae TaxID=165561 RepID=A0AA39KGM3_MICHY|nr:hypothetical protein PV327_010034 [Microctonus hyperodae]
MTTELSRDVDAHIVSLLTKLASLQKHTQERPENRRILMSTEARSLELWKAVAVECFATFLFSLLVLGAAASSNVYGSGLSVLATAIASGFAISAIYLIFGHISGGHVNPAVSISFALSKKISPLRAALYLAAQCGGGIAGAAMLYGVIGTQAMPSSTRSGIAVEKLLVEMALSIFVVLAHFAANLPKSPSILSTRSAGVLAAAYTAATLVSTFYSIITYRCRKGLQNLYSNNIGIFGLLPVAGASSSIYSAPPTATERVESIYGGTKSLYCKSPPLTRANLNRSQSVYAKSSASPRDGFFLPKPGPLQPAQSLYQMKIGQSAILPPTRDQLSTSQTPSLPQPGQNQSQNHNSTNQNMQNQLQQCTQSIYGIRGISTSLSTRENGIYGVTTASSIYSRAPAPPPPTSQSPSSQTSQVSHQQQQQQPNSDNASNPRRPESMYGHTSRRSDDSAYGSYQGSSRGNYGKIAGAPSSGHSIQSGLNQYREQSRPSPGPLQQNQAQQGNFQRNSPNPQY